MGARAGGVCYPTVQEAADAWCSTAGGPTSSGMMSCVAARPTEAYGTAHGFFWDKMLTPYSGTQSLVTNVAGVVQNCEPVTWEDGMVVGWGIAMAWFAVFAFNLIRKALTVKETEI